MSFHRKPSMADIQDNTDYVMNNDQLNNYYKYNC